MRNTRLVVVAALTIPLVLVAAYGILTQPNLAGNVNVGYTSFTVNGRTFLLSFLAETQSARQNGLMNSKITNETTVLFVFPKADYYSFWMFDVNSSLDIIWVNATGSIGRVVYLVQDVPGCTIALFCANYQPTAKANFVLEARGGFAKSNSIAVGTTISFSPP